MCAHRPVGSDNQVTVAKPANVADDDLLLAIVNAANSGGDWTTVPFGWEPVTTTLANRTAGVWCKPVPSASAEVATDYEWIHDAGNSRMGG